MVSKSKRSDKIGLPPGSLIHVGHVREEPIHIYTMAYDEANCLESADDISKGLKLPAQEKEVCWTHLDGVHLPEAVKKVGEIYGIHPLTLEDILNTEHHPKMDETDEGIFLVTKKPIINKNGSLSFTSISIILGNFGVISFSDDGEDPFQYVRQRIRSGSGKIRKRGKDYLLYALLDTVVDSYFVVLDQLQEAILRFEQDALSNNQSESFQNFQKLQHNVLQLNQVVKPMRDMVGKLCRIDDPVINESTKKYFEDILDHIVAVSANTEHFRELLTSVLELHISMENTKMNQIVKLLTVFAAIFMPLTFIAGLYGMNFRYMPELDWRYGYFIIVSVMGVIACSMMLFFRLKKWL